MRGLRLRPIVLTVALVAIFACFPPGLRAQGNDLKAEVFARVNQIRLNEGLAPYARFRLLGDAAQRHAEDLAANGLFSTTGSNGSTPGHRIAAAGYTAWRNEDGSPVVSENVWVGVGSIDDAMAYFLGDEASQTNLLSNSFREMGIGIAAGADGRDYYVLDFGVRPNVLPIFINYGDISTESPQVAIRLTNEEGRPGGEGASFMGRAIEIRISNTPEWESAAWQPWEELVAWTLAGAPGENAVYVQFRDGAGRTAASGDTIWLGDTPPTPVPPSPAPASAEAPAEAPARENGETDLPAATSVAALDGEIPVQITPFPTWTPLPTEGLPEEETVTPVEETEYPFGLLLGLQGVAIVLGIYAALRRKGPARNGEAGAR